MKNWKGSIWMKIFTPCAMLNIRFSMNKALLLLLLLKELSSGTCYRSIAVNDDNDDDLAWLAKLMLLILILHSLLSLELVQLAYQLKIFVAAIFFRVILKRQLSMIQWFSLVILFAGVCLTQISDATNAGQSDTVSDVWKQLLALGAVFVACICSGFAGVYFEKLLKGSHKSVAVRNIQLSFYGIISGITAVFIKDGQDIMKEGFLFGYDGVVWASILLLAIGGLLIAATIRYADNILKGFAPAVAIVLNFIISIFLFNFTPSWMFILGALLVTVSTVLYSICPPPKLVQPIVSDSSSNETV